MALGKGIPLINGFDLNSKLPLDSRAVADTMEEMNKLATDGSVGDGQLCYCKADKKLYVLKDNVWSEVGGGGGTSVIELTDKNGTIDSTQLGEINANPQNFAFKYNGKILLFTSSDSSTYQYCNNTTSSSDNNVMTTSTLLTITLSTGAYTIAENVHNVVANSIHPANGGDLTNIQVGSKVYSIPSGGGGIPVVEGTIEELTEEEQSGGAVAKWSIPTAQSNNFIFYDNKDEGWYFMSNLGGVYSCNFNVPGLGNYIFYGVGTFIYLLNNATSTNTIPYYVIENFNDGDHNQSGFVMPTEDVVLFTNGRDTSLIGYKNGTSYICYEWKSVVESGQHKYKYFMYRITKSNVGYNIEIINSSEALDTNFEFLPNYSSSDNGKILAIDSGNPKWIASSSSSKTVSLFGRHSILAPLSSNDSDINLFSHSITSVNGNNQLLIQIYSSDNLPVNSPADLATVLVVYRKIIVSGIYENSPIFMLDWKGYASSVFYTVANPTTGIPLSNFTTFEDVVMTI